MRRHPSITVYTMSEVIITVRGESERRVAPERAVAHVTATDVLALSDWLNELAAIEGLQVGTVEWQLTPETRARVEREVATDAVAVAVARARAYAGAIDRSAVEPLQIADLGLLGGSSPEPPAPRMFARAAMAMDGARAAPAVDFRPDDILVTAAVEARFRA